MAEYLKLPEVARRLGISEKTARRMVKGGKLPALFIGNAYRVTEEDLATYLRNAHVDPKAPGRSPSEPSLFNGLAEERREAIYQPWAEFVNRFADRWEAQIAAGVFDLPSLQEFDRVTDDLLDTLSPLGLQEKREQPVEYPYSFGPIIGEAIGRLFDLFDRMLAAAEEFPREVLGDELEPLRRKRDAQSGALRRGA